MSQILPIWQGETPTAVGPCNPRAAETMVAPAATLSRVLDTTYRSSPTTRSAKNARRGTWERAAPTRKVIAPVCLTACVSSGSLHCCPSKSLSFARISYATAQGRQNHAERKIRGQSSMILSSHDSVISGCGFTALRSLWLRFIRQTRRRVPAPAAHRLNPRKEVKAKTRPPS
jgi:hypothetical protein